MKRACVGCGLMSLVTPCSGAGDKDKGNSMNWDFDADSSVTMVRTPKSKEAEPPAGANHTPNHHGIDNGEVDGRQEAVDGKGEEGEEGEGAGTPVTEQPPQLGIDDTAFVSTGQRSSVVSSGEGERGGKRSSVVSAEEGGKRGSVVSVEGSSGLVVVSH